MCDKKSGSVKQFKVPLKRKLKDKDQREDKPKEIQSIKQKNNKTDKEFVFMSANGKQTPIKTKKIKLMSTKLGSLLKEESDGHQTSEEPNNQLVPEVDKTKLSDKSEESVVTETVPLNEFNDLFGEDFVDDLFDEFLTQDFEEDFNLI